MQPDASASKNVSISAGRLLLWDRTMMKVVACGVGRDVLNLKRMDP